MAIVRRAAQSRAGGGREDLPMTRLPRLLLAAVVWLLAMLLAMGPAAAITNGQPDAGRHPYVGLMVAHDADGVPLWRCSGSLLSPTVFLRLGIAPSRRQPTSRSGSTRGRS